MSECIVRMKVPENCYECDIYLSAFINCPVYSVAFGYQNRHKYIKCRHPDCPIGAILPEGHGRLVDADAMADDVRRLWDLKTVDGITVTTVLKQTLTDIGNCPTIVPAERSET